MPDPQFYPTLSSTVTITSFSLTEEFSSRGQSIADLTAHVQEVMDRLLEIMNLASKETVADSYLVSPPITLSSEITVGDTTIQIELELQDAPLDEYLDNITRLQMCLDVAMLEIAKHLDDPFGDKAEAVFQEKRSLVATIMTYQDQLDDDAKLAVRDMLMDYPIQELRRINPEESVFLAVPMTSFETPPAGMVERFMDAIRSRMRG